MHNCYDLQYLFEESLENQDLQRCLPEKALIGQKICGFHFKLYKALGQILVLEFLSKKRGAETPTAEIGAEQKFMSSNTVPQTYFASID